MLAVPGLKSSRVSWLALVFTFLSLVSLVTASKPTSFCKCTCFSNSTIIPLDPDGDSGAFNDALNLHGRTFDGADISYSPVEDDRAELEERADKHRKLTCNDCNRKFCLGYELPTCKGAKEEDVFTTCFQRDSRKDQAVVFIFIIATGGLLVWALCKPWIERYVEAARERRSYMPVAEPDS
ncbi:hypothetical protein N7468_001972 [Penicillium chermesinum]|uniref:Uncharacterized protein n=1 Tax=Penicillium chermesinum TaxID=63820 RepID=A0A9W9PHV6_9EURO|nr:uncharacterized protein N7468_001972 [Penicillium chermesinum]KAJ5246989.1 hypothetical protein N7468_001972 [Penicillium chermesinum]KAJ6145240.1 hypothetical protein N7470_009135 [Penicillium chermesinum]